MKSDLYHEDVVAYNKAFAEFAEEFAQNNTINDPVVERWIHHIAKQHRFHQGRHESILKRRAERSALVGKTENNENNEVSA